MTDADVKQLPRSKTNKCYVSMEKAIRALNNARVSGLESFEVGIHPHLMREMEGWLDSVPYMFCIQQRGAMFRVSMAFVESPTYWPGEVDPAKVQAVSGNIKKLKLSWFEPPQSIPTYFFSLNDEQ